MTQAPLRDVGRWLTFENAIEVSLPLAAAAGSWWLALKVLIPPSFGRPLTSLELNALLGTCVCLTAWAVGRQVYMFGRRSPRIFVPWAMAGSLLTLLVVSVVVPARFESRCSGLSGQVIEVDNPLIEGALERRCAIGAVQGNVYLPGVLLRPAWDGALGALQWTGFALLSLVSSLAFRDRRFRKSSVPSKVMESLRLAPTVGAKGVLGEPPSKEGAVQACANATLWGEICGQLYSADAKFEEGAWCQRCQQPFRPVERELHFKVVSLFSADIDVLNGLERLDTVSWTQGDPISPDARVSGQERWAVLGAISVPDVVTVAQLLAMVQERLEKWGQSDPSLEKTCALARERSSRIHAWIWSGSCLHRLTYANPTPDSILVLGASRLRDLSLDGAEELYLQLDIGFLPLELRIGFKKSFLEQNRAPEIQNSKLNLWIPVAPAKPPRETQGVWVPRIEGDALRAWLSTERFRATEQRGVTVPLPYRPFSETAPPTDPRAPSRLDFVRMALDPDKQEPILERRIGDSISEWHWLEARQIEILRNESLVLVESA